MQDQIAGKDGRLRQLVSASSTDVRIHRIEGRKAAFLLLCGLFAACQRSIPVDDIARISSEGATVAPIPGFTFDAKNLFDGDLKTSWQVHSPVGSLVYIRLKEPKRLARVRIANGYQWIDHPTYGNLLLRNSRVSRLELWVFVRLPDGKETIFVQQASLPDRSIPGWDTVSIDWEKAGSGFPKAVTALQIRPVDSYKGQTWSEIAISDIELIEE